MRGWSIAGALAIACSACGDGTSGWILRIADAGSDARVAQDAGLPELDAGIDATGVNDAAIALPDPAPFAEACSPEVTVDNMTASGNGALFDQAFPEPEAALVAVARQVCALLYKAPDEPPRSPPIVLVIDDFFGIGEIGITAQVAYIRLSSLNMQNDAAEGKDVRHEVEGDLYYLLAVDYAHDNEDPSAVGWMLEGIAAYTRLRAGHILLEERRAGGDPTDDYVTAGFFFDYIDRTYPDAIYRLNQSFDPEDGVVWTDEVFVDITGKDINTLWLEYQASL